MPEIMNQPQQSDEQNKIINIYAAFGVGLVMAFLPSIIAALVSMTLIIGVLIVAYAIRKGVDKGSLTENHMTFIIRTMWISGVFTIITMIAGSAYLLGKIDNSPLDGCIQQFLNMSAGLETMGLKGIMNIFNPCIDSFIKVNMRVFIISSAITAGPVLLYFIYRYVKGLSRAIKGYRIAKPGSWF